MSSLILARIVLLPLDSQSDDCAATASAAGAELPIGSCDAEQFFRVVSPMTQTAAPERSSLSENMRRCASVQLPRLEVRIRRSGHASIGSRTADTLSPTVETGAIAVTESPPPEHVRHPARRNGLELPDAPPGPTRWPGITVSRFAPMLAMSAVTWAVAPLPSVTMMITDATPMMIPSVVSDERRTFRRIPRRARTMA